VGAGFGQAKLRRQALGNSPEDQENLKARLARLSADLQAQREADRQEAERKAQVESSGKNLGQAISLGFRVLTEFVGPIIVGALIGWRLDVWLNTTPFLLILWLGFGVAAGFRNVYRLAAPPPPGRSGGDRPPQS
jgi:ATP synthase protein I